MHYRTSLLIILIALGLTLCFLLPWSVSLAAVDIGAAMPDFKLKDCDGKEHTLSGYKGKIVVLDFCSQGCPWSRGADPHLAALSKEYGAKGVVFLGVDSHSETTPEEIKAYAAKTGIPHPILKDTGNSYADAVGAERTPEIYIADKEGKLVYHGAFDNRKNPDKAGDINYVKKALDSVLGGQSVETAKVNAWGCTIKRAKGA
ncbi:MAG: redoxin domain-containing protein [Candidatus Hydrogenedentes bacterium]|nr:redoxin domain-containing protein [Candidatus Hydrogenedentota bacterium]